eukprot:jgi/Botrbrau1/15286/Bobra.97_1s0011.1
MGPLRPVVPHAAGPCHHCGESLTCCWRKGPAEKPHLCNACGSRWLAKKDLKGYYPGKRVTGKPSYQEDVSNGGSYYTHDDTEADFFNMKVPTKKRKKLSGSPVSSYQYAQNSDPRFVEPRSTFKRSIGTQTDPIKTQVIIIRDPSGAGVIPHPPSILERLPSGMGSLSRTTSFNKDGTGIPSSYLSRTSMDGNFVPSRPCPALFKGREALQSGADTTSTDTTERR